MKAGDYIPTAVLTEELREVVAERRVRAAVFTTFTYDPGFFELNILPALFDQPFSPVDKVRRIQLEDAVRNVDAMAVYYDRSGLTQNAEPAVLDYARIDVRRRTGVFHPKVVLLLVDDPSDDDSANGLVDATESCRGALIVGVLSANLTREGWWENIECAHFEEIKDKDVSGDRCSFRADILDLVLRIRRSTDESVDHRALDQVREFIVSRTNNQRLLNATSRGRYYPRIFCGQKQQAFGDWLRDLKLRRRTWNLEILSPFLDHRDAGALRELVDQLNPRAVRVYFPRNRDGRAAVDASAYESVEEVAEWGDLPTEIVERRTQEVDSELLPRHVHAKVYRLWSREEGEVLIVGSVNSTRAAHSAAQAGNLEAAFLVDVSDSGYPRRWWLNVDVPESLEFPENPGAEEDDCENVLVDLTLRFDWATGRLDYRLSSETNKPVDICDLGARRIFRIEKLQIERWHRCENSDAEKIREHLCTSSIVLARRGKSRWRVLIREENMVHKPSLLQHLTPEEILEFWSLLTPEQRANFLEWRIGRELSIEGLEVISPQRLERISTMFDRFAGIFHAFAALRAFIVAALEEGREKSAEARLAGAHYDSLPGLLEKVVENADKDPEVAYVTLLCAKQLRQVLARSYPAFFRRIRGRTGALDAALLRTGEIRQRMANGSDFVSEAFLDWYEESFLTEVRADTEVT